MFGSHGNPFCGNRYIVISYIYIYIYISILILSSASCFTCFILILNVCGLHASTQPMASLAVAMVQCWTMFEMQLPQPDDRITIDSLGVRTPSPRSFSNLPCALGSANDLTRLEHAARKASQTLLAWQWAEGSTDLPDDLVDSMTDVKLALEDVVFILQAAGQIKS